MHVSLQGRVASEWPCLRLSVLAVSPTRTLRVLEFGTGSRFYEHVDRPLPAKTGWEPVIIASSLDCSPVQVACSRPYAISSNDKAMFLVGTSLLSISILFSFANHPAEARTSSCRSFFEDARPTAVDKL